MVLYYQNSDRNRSGQARGPRPATHTAASATPATGGVLTMDIDGHRWLMTAVNAPLERTAFRPEPGPADVVVAVAGCGVCHTDLGYLYDGVHTNHPLPLALGHEVSGRVVATGKEAASWMGKAVIVPAVLPCGECDL